MVVDDIVVMGAKSMFMTDYIACGKLVPSRIAEIVTGIAKACSEVDVALLGGETAEHPGLLGENEYDLAGAAVGAVEAAKVLGPEKVKLAMLYWDLHLLDCTPMATLWFARLSKTASWITPNQYPSLDPNLLEKFCLSRPCFTPEY
jgi:hypothetical protein